MKITPTPLQDAYLITFKPIQDTRGQLYESFRQDQKPPMNVAQINVSWSKKNVLRGLHYQKTPHTQAKRIYVLQGLLLDVIVDLRPSSATYKQHFKTQLSSTKPQALHIPKGFAHGFLALSDVLIKYVMDEVYVPQAQAGIHFQDPELNIPWPLKGLKPTLSEKDKQLPFLSHPPSVNV